MLFLCEKLDGRGFRPNLPVAFSCYWDLHSVLEDSCKFYWPYCRNGEWVVKTTALNEMGNFGPCTLIVDTLKVQNIRDIDWPANLVIRKLSLEMMYNVELVVHFLEAHQVRELEVERKTNWDVWHRFIRHRAVVQISSLTVKYDIAADATTALEDLLALAHTILLPRIDKGAIRALLKAWNSELRSRASVGFWKVTGFAADFESIVNQVKDELMFDSGPRKSIIGRNRFVFAILRDNNRLKAKFSLHSGGRLSFSAELYPLH